MYQEGMKLHHLIPRLRRAALILASVALANTAQAQIHVPVYTGTPLLITSGVLNQQIVESATRPVLKSGNREQERIAPQAAKVDTVVADASTHYAAKLTQGYPAARRPEALRVFNELLESYRSIEGQFGIPRNDVAGAVAAFLAGSYMAFRNVDFPDEHFPPLVEQMRRIIASRPDFAAASATEKREMYEQMAILGMFMATTQMGLKTQPDPALQAKLRQSAREYLETFLRVDAERVQITATGLSLP